MREDFDAFADKIHSGLAEDRKQAAKLDVTSAPALMQMDLPPVRFIVDGLIFSTFNF